MKTFILVICFAASSVFGQPSERTLSIIEMVESSGRGANTPDGDNGKAIGPYQIHHVYWKDAVEYDKSLASGTYEDCRDPAYAKRVVIAYLTRYGKNKTDEEMARIHNGGPTGHKKKSTLGYLAKYRKAKSK